MSENVVEARLTAKDDGLTSALERIEQALRGVENATKRVGDIIIKAQDKASPTLEKAEKKVNKFDNKDAKAVLDAKDNATEKVEKASKAIEKLGNENATTKIDAQDHASSMIEKIKSKLSGIKENAHFPIRGRDESDGAINSVKSKLNGLKSVAQGVLQGFGQKAFSVIGDQFSGFVGEMNDSSKAWKTFEGNMKAFGASGEEINRVRGSLSKFATESIYSASEMASTYSQLSAVGIQNCEKLVTGFGGLASASESPKQAMKTLSQQATQMAAKPMVAWEDFKLMLEQTPAGVSAVAKQMGMSTSELIEKVHAGTLATQDFFDAISEVGNNDSFGKMAREYKGVDEAMQGLMETLQNKLKPGFDALSTFGIKAISGIADSIDNINLDAIAQKFSWVPKIIENIKSAWDKFVQGIASTGAFEALGNALESLNQWVSNLSQSLSGDAVSGAQSFGQAIGNIAKFVADAISKFLEFDSSTGNLITKLGAIGLASASFGGVIGKVASKATSAFSTIKSLFGVKLKNPFSKVPQDADEAFGKTQSKVAQVVKSVGSAFKGIGQGISTAFKGIGAGIATVFQGIASAISMLNPVGVASFAGVVLTLVGAFLALSACKDMILPFLQGLSDIFTGVLNSAVQIFTNALIQLAPIFPVLASSLAQLAPLVIALGSAFSTAVQGIGTAISTIITALAPIVETIGNVFTQCVQIVSNAIVQIVQALAPFMPNLESIVQSVSQAITSICDSFNTLVTSIVPILQEAQNVIEQFGDSISQVLDSAGGVIEDFGNAVSSVLDSVAGIFDSIGNAALNAGKGFNQLATGIGKLVAMPLGDLSGTLIATAGGLSAIAGSVGGLGDSGAQIQALATGLLMLSNNVTSIVSASAMMPQVVAQFQTLTNLSGPLLTASASLQAFATSVISASASMISAGVGFAMISAMALQAVSGLSVLGSAGNLVASAMAMISSSTSSVSSSIGSFASTTASSFSQVGSQASSMGSSVVSAMSIMASAFASGVSRAKSYLSQLIQAMMQTASRAGSVGRKTGSLYSSGLRSGLSSAVGTARSMVASIVSALSAGAGRAYSCGLFIGQGLAQGLNASAGMVASAAARLASAADAAIQAKARIGSPSKVQIANGRWMGEGFAIGLRDKVREVKRASEELIFLPKTLAGIMSMDFAYSGGYDAYRSVRDEYTQETNVYLNVNGREFAKATYSDFESVGKMDEKFKKKIRGER